MIIESVRGQPLISLAGSYPTTAFGVPKLMVKLQTQLHNTQTDIIRSYNEMVITTLDSQPLSFLTERKKTTS
jgi:hypothetical protein